MLMKKLWNKKVLIVIVLVLCWTALHIPGIFYGTSDSPMHVSYLTADEQSPINGALHIMEAKNLLVLQSHTTLYYGPLFAVMALPGVIADFAFRLVTGAVTGAQSYKDFIVFNWGGILAWSRLLAVLVGFMGMVAMYLLFLTRAINPSRKRWIAYSATLLLGANYLYFEYANFFRHWIFVIVVLLWQLYLLVRIVESENDRKWLWFAQVVLTVFTFGISYIGIMYEVIWLPVLVKWLRDRSWKKLKEFAWYILWTAAGSAFIIWWYPYAFEKILSVVGLAPSPTSMGAILDITGSVPVVSHSFWFYAHIVLVNDWLLFVVGLILLAALLWKRKIYRCYWLWTFIAPAALTFLVFGYPAHHETRYALPMVVMLAVATLALYSVAQSELRHHKKIIKLSGLLLGLSLAISIIQIVGWERMIVAGPEERRDIVPQLIAWQKQDPASKFLVYQSWPIGYAHTNAAYRDYVTNFGKSDYDMWKYIITISPPKDVTPLNIYYSHNRYEPSEKDKAYSHIIVKNNAILDQAIWDGSPYDEFDYRPWQIWTFKDYEDSYTIVK